jgi:perosamine synthetase
MPSNGSIVSEFEKAFAERVGAKYAIGLTNGTVTIQAALVACGLKPGFEVRTTPLTMSATSIAILNAGCTPVFVDVDPHTWLMTPQLGRYAVAVSLYGLHYNEPVSICVDDAAQTLRPHNKRASFTSYSLQRSKILNTGEGGVLTTDSERLAIAAREYTSLGYRMKATQSRIDPSTLKDPSFERHHTLGINARMNDVTAAEGLKQLERANQLLLERNEAASRYRAAISGCEWITKQSVPEYSRHDSWAFAIALKDKSLWKPFTESIVRHGGEMPYGAWRLTFDEPAFRHLNPVTQTAYEYPLDIGERRYPCPVAEDLQPRLVQLQTNDLASAERNAKAVRKAIGDMDVDMAMAPIERTIANLRACLPDATGIPCE